MPHLPLRPLDITPEGMKLTKREKDTSSMVGLTILGAITVVVTASALFAYFNTYDPAGGITIANRQSIAVLPFDNLSGLPEDQYISDGIVEDLLVELTRVKELRVVGRKASFYYRDRDEAWDVIADKLGAAVGASRAAKP